MKKLKEALGVLAIFIFLLGPAILFQQYWLALVFGIFGVCFGIVEWVAVTRSGHTVSQHFWIWSENNKVKAWILLLSMLAAWLFLLGHFAYKHLL